MAAKKVVVGAWLWWVVVGSVGLGFVGLLNAKIVPHTVGDCAGPGGDAVSNHEWMSRASKDLVFSFRRRCTCGFVFKGKTAQHGRCALVRARLWSAMRSRYRKRGYHFCVVAGRDGALLSRGLPRLYPYSLSWVCQVGWWLKSGSSCSGGLKSEPGLIVVPRKASMAVARS